MDFVLNYFNSIFLVIVLAAYYLLLTYLSIKTSKDIPEVATEVPDFMDKKTKIADNFCASIVGICCASFFTLYNSDHLFNKVFVLKMIVPATVMVVAIALCLSWNIKASIVKIAGHIS